MTFERALSSDAERIGNCLQDLLQEYRPSTVRDGMIYATSGGKRLRGFLVLQSAALHQIPKKDSIWSAAAIEALHAYSLVHDDLPCMDDDDLRRGRPTVHKKWDEATAVLVGDALQSFAFEVIGDGELPSDRKLQLSTSLAHAAGATGMVLGQALDIAAESAATPLDLDGITDLQSGKTGALIEWSATAGAVMAGEDTGPLSIYASALGLAFQIADDLLDVEGDEKTAGKRLKKDEEAGKATFVSLLGVDGAKARAKELVEDAIDALSLYSAQADYLRDTARFVISRDK